MSCMQMKDLHPGFTYASASKGRGIGTAFLSPVVNADRPEGEIGLPSCAHLVGNLECQQPQPYMSQ